MNHQHRLFQKDSLDAKLRSRQEGIAAAVDHISKDQFMISTDEEVIDYIISKWTVIPISLQENLKSMTQNETRIDVARDTSRFFPGEIRGSYLVPGTQIDIDIPFTGEDWIFQYKTNPWSTVSPTGRILPGHVRLSLAQPHDADSSAFKLLYEIEFSRIRDAVDRARQQVNSYNGSLPNLVRQAVKLRREQLSRHSNISALLDIPLATRPGAPSITPVKIELRRPTLPVPPKTGLVPEPGITDEKFENVLHFIRHQGRTYERTPSTYAVHGEEDLRNIMLGQLNGHYVGAAVGEAFRVKGKTDISIEQDNRAAFVGECKLWTGPAGLISALDQLLGYLTWRDSKAALIIFNARNKDFSKILETMPATLRAHPLFLRDLPNSESAEWRMQMRSKEDAGRRVTVHCFVFNLYQQA